MVSPSFSTKLVFFACFVLFTFSHKLVTGESDKVELNLYYESLCPGCQSFIVDELVKVFDSDLDTITDVKLVPFGYAKVSNNLTVICQVLFNFLTLLVPIYIIKDHHHLYMFILNSISNKIYRLVNFCSMVKRNANSTLLKLASLTLCLTRYAFYLLMFWCIQVK